MTMTEQAKLKGKYDQLNAQIASGEAVEMYNVWVQFISGTGQEILVDQDALGQLHDLIEPGDRKTIKVSAIRYMDNCPITLRLRSEFCIFLIEQDRARFFLVGDETVRVPANERGRLC